MRHARVESGVDVVNGHLSAASHFGFVLSMWITSVGGAEVKGEHGVGRDTVRVWARSQRRAARTSQVSAVRRVVDVDIECERAKVEGEHGVGARGHFGSVGRGRAQKEEVDARVRCRW